MPWVNLAYYPGWVQKQISPDRLPWDSISHVAHFGRYPLPDGSLPVADMQTESFHAPLVAAARNAGRVPLLTIGGGGSFGGQTIGANFAAACSSTAARARLVAATVGLVDRYGYGGVDVDWEEAVPAHADAWVALMKDLRAALGTRILTAAVVSGLVPGSVAARAAGTFDWLNVMAYWTDGADQVAHYRAAGIPAGKLVVGAGFSNDPDFHDGTAAAVRAKVQVARSLGCAGVMFWQAGDLAPSSTTDPRLQPLREAMMPVTYPGARWTPLGAETENRQTTHNLIIVHTMAGYLVSTDNFFRAGNGQGYIGLESHLGVGGKWGPDLAGDLDGAVWQWQDLDYQAQANGDANQRAISIETADNAPALPADIEPWTAAQLDALVDLIAWLCRKYDIPPRLVPDTMPTTAGIAYHAQGTAASLPAGWERWSSTVGKPCPTTRRINQLISVVIPRVQLALDQEEDDMSQADVDAINAHTDQVVAAQVAAAQTEILRQLAANLGVTAVNNGNSWLNTGIAARLGANERAMILPLLDDEANIVAAVAATEKDITAAIGRVVAGGTVDPTDPVFVRAVAAELGAAVGRGTEPPPPPA